MSWWSGWFSGGVRLDAERQRRLAAWQALPPVDLHAPLQVSRCVVVDVETTGLDLARDRLISIGAVAVVNGKVVPGDSFYVVLRQPQVSGRENILVHGISGAQQSGGEPPADALLDFLDFLGKDPLVAFHVTFDETMIARALREHLGLSFRHPWLDLAYVMPGLNPSLASRHRGLDDWLGHAGIRIAARHHALADALATAQLFLVASAQARKKGALDFAALENIERAQRWVSRVSSL